MANAKRTVEISDTALITECFGKMRSRFIYSYLSAAFSVYFEKLIPLSLTFTSMESS